MEARPPEFLFMRGPGDFPQYAPGQSGKTAAPLGFLGDPLERTMFMSRLLQSCKRLVFRAAENIQQETWPHIEWLYGGGSSSETRFPDLGAAILHSANFLVEACVAEICGSSGVRRVRRKHLRG